MFLFRLVASFSLLVAVAKASNKQPKSLNVKVFTPKNAGQHVNTTVTTTNTTVTSDAVVSFTAQEGAYELEEQVFSEKNTNNCPPPSPFKIASVPAQSNLPWWVENKENEPAYLEETQRILAQIDQLAVAPKKVEKGKESEESEDEEDYEEEIDEEEDESSLDENNSSLPLWWMKHKEITDYDSEPFAEGSFGFVYHATLKGKRKAAIKVVKVDLLTPRGLRQKEALLREIEIQKKLKSKWTVKLYFEMEHREGDLLQFAMFMEDGGMALDDIYEFGNVKKINNDNESRVARASFYLASIYKGLAVCHKNKFLHRDLALKNVLVNRKGQVKLCDFGLSVKMDKNGLANGYVGTLSYMSPKILHHGNKSYGVDADFYALGVCLFVIDQMEDPFADIDEEEVVEVVEEWHAKGNRLWKNLDYQSTDMKIVNAIRVLCDVDGATKKAVKSLALFDIKYKKNSFKPPKSVLEDIENHY